MAFNNAITPINQINTTGEKNFTPFGRGWEIREMPIKLSVAYAAGSAMRWETSGSTSTGYLTGGGNNSGVNTVGSDFAGILIEPTVATDADYATAFKTRRVAVPISPEARARFTVGAGTFTSIDVGKTCIITSTHIGLSVDTNGLGARIEGVISSTRGICSFNLPSTATA
jgi:hypothetical protein